MNSDDRDFWFQIGYALERARTSPLSVPGLEALRRRGRGSRPREASRPEPDVRDDVGHLLSRVLLRRGARSLGPLVLGTLPLRKSTGVLHLVGAGACGAAVSIVLEALAPVIRSGRFPLVSPDALAAVALAGAGRGITYGGVVEPRLPGPAVLLGFLYGTAEFVAAPSGGLASLLGRAAPQKKVPFLADLLGGEDVEDGNFVQHVLFGIGVALLYDSLRVKSGMEAEE